jgi:hypothetical protein
MKRSIEAGVHFTELTRLLEVIPEADRKKQFEKFIDVRMQANLRKDGIEAIHKYKEDYWQAKEHYRKAKQYVIRAENLFMRDEKLADTEMEYANGELDNLVMLGGHRVKELLEGLQEAYKVLGKID